MNVVIPLTELAMALSSPRRQRIISMWDVLLDAVQSGGRLIFSLRLPLTCSSKRGKKKNYLVRRLSSE